MNAFDETQRFRQPWLLVLMVFLVVTSLGPMAYGLYLQMVAHRPFGTNPMPDRALLTSSAVTLAFVGAVLWLMLASYLRVEVRDEALFIRFFPFIRGRSIAYSDIIEANARTYSPLGEYGGWGVRYGRNGKAYNVSGNRGVQLEMADGERLLLGSQRADELASAIRERSGQGRLRG